jgi:3-phenylpropionate/trans-cinnamate dioxygenase ferredoxin reductase component
LAGAGAARTLRDTGFDGEVVLIGAESHAPYERPPLSKEYLRGESTRAGAVVEPEQYWAEHSVDLRTGVAAKRIDVAAGRLDLADGTSVAFDRLLVAPGAEPRPLPTPGSALDGVVTLRSFGDADSIRVQAADAAHVLVVGGGWIASEVAASLRQLGHSVTLAVRGRHPLERALGRQLGEVYRRLHIEHGVTVLTGTDVVALEGRGRVRRARTAEGAWLDADLVVVAVGVDPRTDLARNAGLAVGDGIVVDERLATSDPRIFAAGDVSLAPYSVPGRTMRVEHWGTALAQGEHAARAMVGASAPFAGMPYYFSDQYDTGMEFWGNPVRPGELVVRGELDAHSFTAFWHEAGRVTAVLNMHVHHHAHDAGHDGGHGDHHGDGHVDPVVVEELIRASAPIEVGALRDPHIPLAAIAANLPVVTRQR